MSRRLTVPTPDDLARALAVVRAHLPPTPAVATTAAPDGLLKLECLQPTGSFKVRGALAGMAALSEEERERGVVTASAGNHGLGVAYAASRLGVPATVVVPTTASPAKVAALHGYPVTLVQAGNDYFAAEQHALGLAAAGATYLSAYNECAVIAGQASIGAELDNQVDAPMTVVVPVGGGGLSSGICLWAAQRPGVRVIGVEAAASMPVSAAASAGRVVEVPVGETLADGLAGNIESNSITPAIIQAHAYALTSVSEAEIRAAIRFLAARHGLVVEGSGAVGVAALLAGKVAIAGRPVAIVTGRNIELSTVARILAEPDVA